jgi:hypothetical protein
LGQRYSQFAYTFSFKMKSFSQIIYKRLRFVLGYVSRKNQEF